MEIKQQIGTMMQLKALGDGTQIEACENDRKRSLFKNGDDVLFCDDNGGFIVDQIFLDTHSVYATLKKHIYRDFIVIVFPQSSSVNDTL